MKITYIDPTTKIQYWLGQTDGGLFLLSTEETDIHIPESFKNNKIEFFIVYVLGDKNITIDGKAVSIKDKKYESANCHELFGGIYHMMPSETERKKLIMEWIYESKQTDIRQEVYDLIATIKTPIDIVNYDGYIPQSIIDDFAKANIVIHQVVFPNMTAKSFIYFKPTN